MPRLCGLRLSERRTTMTKLIDKLPTAVDELTETELETVAGGGGGVGVNPSLMGSGAGVNPSRAGGRGGISGDF
jgi:hypothetical protein